MKIVHLLIVLGCTLAIGAAPPNDGKAVTKEPAKEVAKEGGTNLTRTILPDEQPAASATLKAWLEARGIECQQKNQTVVVRRGLLLNITPITSNGGLDRLLVMSFYFCKDEHKKSPELRQLAEKHNRAQNLLRVFCDDDGDLAAGSSLTFCDELTAKEFDSFLDLYVAVVRRWVLTEETLKYLK